MWVKVHDIIGIDGLCLLSRLRCILPMDIIALKILLTLQDWRRVYVEHLLRCRGRFTFSRSTFKQFHLFVDNLLSFGTRWIIYHHICHYSLHIVLFLLPTELLWIYFDKARILWHYDLWSRTTDSWINHNTVVLRPINHSLLNSLLLLTKFWHNNLRSIITLSILIKLATAACTIKFFHLMQPDLNICWSLASLDVLMQNLLCLYLSLLLQDL